MLKNLPLKIQLFYFWGVMDLLALAAYCFHAVRQGRTPFCSDIVDFSNLHNASGAYGAAVILFFSLDLLLLSSLFLSAWLFMRRSRYAPWLAFGQEALRFLSLRCSVTLFPLLTTLSGLSNLWFNLLLFCISEIIKVSSLVYVVRSKR